MSPVRLVATDLDGTLLAPDGWLTERTVAAVRAATRAGITVVAATGRSYFTAIQRLAPATDVRWLVCSNGALIYDRDIGALTAHHPIDDLALVPLVSRLGVALPGCFFGWEVAAGFGWERAFLERRPAVGRVATTVHEGIGADGRWPSEVTKLFVGHPALERDALLEAALPLMDDGLVATCSGASFIEVTGAGVDKAFGVARLCRDLGVDAGEVLAIGDHLNDVAMLRWAGRSVAMGGAHPAALAEADETAPSHAEDGVAQVLESLLIA
jgi:hydroxymethylpyrimidine pyrophosphatase-like HAD family hydrolase